MMQEIAVPAPMGGINTFDPAAAMPPQDCIYCYNMVASELGMRARLGFREWNIDAIIPFGTLIGYHGSRQDGTADKLFGVNQTAIYDVSGNGPAVQQIAFPDQLGNGIGAWHVFKTPGGSFILFCDEVHGLYLYTETTGTWSQVSSGVTAPWATNIFVAVGTQVVNAGNQYICRTAGTTASAGAGPTTNGAGIADGATVTWDFVQTAAVGVIGPSVADQNNGLYQNPASLTGTFCFVAGWGSRVWLVEKNSTRAWYLAPNAILGTATSFDFGIKMPHGGPLVGLYGWSYDGGSGMKTELVAISTAGDIVIFEGTDPSSASTFALRGAWFSGGLPAGRRIAVEFGGEVLILSQLGVLPLSKLVTGSSIFDRAQYATQKIHNLFSSLTQNYGALPGWSIGVHPQDNALIVTVPQPQGLYLQLVMSFSTKGWTQYRGLPVFSQTTWEGQFYFADQKGRVLLNKGYQDNVPIPGGIGSTAVAVPVAWSFLTAFQDGKTMQRKLMRLVKLNILSGVAQPGIETVAKFDYDIDEPTDTSQAVAQNLGPQWDVSQWDVAQWSGDFVPAQIVQGLAGIGRAVALAVRGQAISRTVYVGASIAYELGGFL